MTHWCWAHLANNRTFRSLLEESRPDGQLDFATAALHALEGLRQISQTNLFRHEVLPNDITAANGFEGFANKPRRVMKGRNQLDFGIMDRGRVDRNVRS